MEAMYITNTNMYYVSLILPGGKEWNWNPNPNY